MALKNILVHVGGEQRRNAVDLAAQLAAQFDAHIVGLHIMAPPQIPPYVEAQLGGEVMEIQARFAAEEAGKAKEVFQSIVEHNGLSSEWRTREGDPVEILQLHGRYADMVVLGQANRDEPGPRAGDDIASRLVLSLGRPVLCVPYSGTYGTVGKRILVAWDGGRAAARAVGDAMPILERAEEVSVLTLNSDHGVTDGMDLATHLARHDIQAVTQNLQAADMEVGAMLLSRAEDFGADLIVMERTAMRVGANWSWVARPITS